MFATNSAPLPRELFASKCTPQDRNLCHTWKCCGLMSSESAFKCFGHPQAYCIFSSLVQDTHCSAQNCKCNRSCLLGCSVLQAKLLALDLNCACLWCIPCPAGLFYHTGNSDTAATAQWACKLDTHSPCLAVLVILPCRPIKAGETVIDIEVICYVLKQLRNGASMMDVGAVCSQVGLGVVEDLAESLVHACDA